MSVFRSVFYALCAFATYLTVCFWLAPMMKNRPEYRQPTPSESTKPPDNEPDSAFVRGCKSVVPIPHVGGDDMTDERDAMTIKP